MSGIPSNIDIPAQAIHNSPAQVTSIRAGMGLAKKYVNIFTLGLRQLMTQHLDVTKTMLHQDQVRLKTYRAAVWDKFPFVARYENAWPINWYTSSHLHEKRRKIPKKKNKSVHAKLPKRRRSSRVNGRHPSTSRDNNEDNPPVPRSVSNARSTVDSTQQNRPAILTPTQHSMRGVEQSVNGHCSTRAHEQPESRSTASTSTANAPSLKKDGFDGVETFLAGLNLVRLAPKFSQAGIVDRQCLHALALMLRAEQDMLLKDEMGLNVFERVVVDKGLTALNDL
ncbi:hypothetical protein A0H81_13577 [Grifola frondosa]|uniref:Uncharacterized protein n=1 Tax=Grifola frondosa TaxID=5627 RepID=A0A1C7LNZ7_GRIFR|nr:hypothetical protein A0H81_13577 [Grifola frondosa]